MLVYNIIPEGEVPMHVYQFYSRFVLLLLIIVTANIVSYVCSMNCEPVIIIAINQIFALNLLF